VQDARRLDLTIRIAMAVGFVAFIWLFVAAGPSYAITKTERAIVDEKADEAVKEFEKKVPQAKELFKSAKGVLVMPALYKAGFLGAAQYGDGVLRVGGKSVDYYNFVALSFGFQAGAQKVGMIMVFNSDEALATFRRNPGFEVGADADVTLITIGEGGSFDTTKAGQQIVAFTFAHRGAMAGVSLKGAKFTKLDKE
jgi:lipid-binding SYLF domain-containing protein